MAITKELLTALLIAVIAVTCQPQPQPSGISGGQNGQIDLPAPEVYNSTGDGPTPSEHRSNCRGRLTRWSTWSECRPIGSQCGEMGMRYKQRYCLSGNQPCDNCGNKKRTKFEGCFVPCGGYDDYDDYDDHDDDDDDYWHRRTTTEDPRKSTTTLPRNSLPCIKGDQEGEWGKWGCWSRCSSGFRVRYRQCDGKWPAGAGNYCKGKHEDSKPCGRRTSTRPTTSITTTEATTPKPCVAGQDVVFAMDASGSIGINNYNTMSQAVLDLMSNFPNLDDGSNRDATSVRSGLLTFSGSTSVVKQLNNFDDLPTFLTYDAGSTMTDLAIMTAIGMFTPANGDRPQNSNVMVVLTDGQSNDRDQTIDAANAAKAAGIKIIAVGVGLNYDRSELEAIASDPNRDVYDITTFDVLRSTLNDLFSCI